MNNSKHSKMGSAPMSGLILSMALPTIFSMLISALYNIVDSMFVSRLGEGALTAVSLAFPVHLLIIAVSTGTGIGVNSIISRRLGEKKYDDANSAATHGVILGICSWLVFALFGILFGRAFLAMQTNDPIVLEMAASYTVTYMVFSFGIFLSISIEKLLQATGNMVFPMFIQLIGAVINLILDPIMIFGLFGFPKLGVLGAVIATVTGQIIGMLFSVWVIVTKPLDVKPQFKGFKFSKQITMEIYKVGFPSIIMQSIGAFLTVALNGILIGFSQAAVAVMGVYFKLQSFVFMPVFGLTQGLMPIMGYNFGAKNKKRLIAAIKTGVLFATIIMLAGTIAFQLFATNMLAMFEASDEMYRVGIPALRTISLCFVSAGIGIIFSTLFQATGHGAKSLIVSLIRQVIVILPLAYMGSRIMGVTAVWIAFPVAESVALVVSFIMFYLVYKKEIKPMIESSDEE